MTRSGSRSRSRGLSSRRYKALSKPETPGVLDATTNATSGAVPPVGMRELIETALDDAKAEDINVIDLSGKSAIADAMIVASGVRIAMSTR